MKLSGYFSFLAYCLLHSLCYVSLGQATNIHIKNLTEKDGLYNYSVFNVLQDQQGFMWMRSHDGLYRYDGARLELFQHEPGDSTTLYSSNTVMIYEDRSGTFWVSTGAGGVQYFDKNSYSFKTYPILQDSLSTTAVHAMYEDQTGLLWLPTNKGLYAYDKKRQILTPFHYRATDSTTISSNGVTTFFEDKAGNLWIGTFDNGLNKFNRQQRNFTRYQHKPDDATSIGGNNIYCMYETTDSTLWIGADYGGGLNAFNPKTGKFTQYKQNPGNPHSGEDNVIAILEDRAGMLWVATWNAGLLALDPKTGQFTCYHYDPKDSTGISSNQAWTIYEDKSGTLWVGTFYGSGLQSLNRQTGKFTHYPTNPNRDAYLYGGGVVGIYEDKAGSLWLIVRGQGVSMVDRTSKKFNVYYTKGVEPANVFRSRTGTLWAGTIGSGLHTVDENTGKLIPYPLPSDQPIEDAKAIYRLLEARDGRLWAVTEGGLRLIDTKKKQVTTYRHNASDTISLSNDFIHTILEDASGDIWLGTAQGLNRFDKSNNTFIRCTSDYAGKNPAANNIRLLYEDTAGMLWVATEEYLGFVDKKQNKLRLFYQAGLSKIISRYKANGLYNDGKGTLWIATYGAGLAALDIHKLLGPEKQAVYTSYTERSGLPSNMITTITADKKGDLWLSTLQGLCRFTPSTAGNPQIRSYNTSDGLKTLDSFSSYVDANGWIYFIGPENIAFLHPDSLRDNPYVPPIVLTDFQLSNEPVSIGEGYPLKRAIGETREITLPYNQSTFSLGFAALNFILPEKNQYAYKLEGYEDEWNYVGNEKMARYVNVPPGTYTFRVKGSNNDGLWNTTGISLSITITPPWWQTMGAYIFYALAFGAALYGLRYYTLSRERLKNSLKLQRIESEKLQEIDRLKSHFFANISHEFRTPLTLLIGPLEKLLSASAEDTPHRPLYQSMHRNAQRLLTLVNQLLDLSKLEAGKMKLEYTEGNLVQFLKKTVFSFSSLAERKQIGFQVRYPETRLLVYFDEDKLEKIISNLLSNAFKFTPEGGTIVVGIHWSSIPEKQIPALVSPEREATQAILLELTVENSGLGIAEEMLPRVFDRFYQADASHTLEGTGIGLSLVRELVELQGGKITVKSESGKGTLFTVKLPLPLNPSHQPASAGELFTAAQEDLIAVNTSQPPVMAAPAADSLAGPTDKDAPLVLIVEDNQDIREFIKQCLHLAYRIMEAADGEQGYKLATEVIPDLILSDVMMPRMDGMVLCQKLKQDEKTSHVPVILLTAKASGESKVEGLVTGADDYIIKPFEARELQVRIKNLIDGRKKLQEHYGRQITLQPAAIAISSADERFLQKAMQAVEAHMADASFGVEEFGEELCMSRMQLFRKLKALTNQSPGDFIKQMRLKRAADLLSKGSGTIAEISYEVGFNSPSYFTKCFYEQYGKTPSEFIAAHPQME